MTLEEKCIAEFETYTRISYDSNNKSHVSVVEDMVAFKTCQLDTTGYSYLSINGINETFRNDYPKPILRSLSNIKKRITIY